MIEKISKWIAERVKEAGAKGVVLGMSGGIDSSVVAVLCRRALGKNALALLMPCHSEPEDMEHAKLVAKRFGIETKIIDLTETYDSIVKKLPGGDKISLANIKPRLRMLTLYYFANLHNYLVAGTSNKTEILTGYVSKYGDSAVDMEPIGDLYKNQVIELARQLDIQDEIISKTPSAGLWKGQTDEGELGIPYKDLDRILDALENNSTGGLDPGKVRKVKDMIRKSRHKREVPPICRL